MFGSRRRSIPLSTRIENQKPKTKKFPGNRTTAERHSLRIAHFGAPCSGHSDPLKNVNRHISLAPKTNNWNSDKRKGEPSFHFLTGKICRLDTYFGTWNPSANTAGARRSALHGYAPKQNTRYFSLPSCQGRSLSLPKNNVCSVHPGSSIFRPEIDIANPAANFADLYQVPSNLPP